ncbi:hypothetical protein [Flavobacterium sp. UMI-01]|uniref:hypothetical protein n=1 Tax=Flavobacterium sp. UMI-01 TaxID=1441053 RepID=UPI001C7DA06A|nr:hypothetical protein [Flavobacterium sp. UMI-01]GIZ09945.1 hypothetical protein FUMI01_26710 [Flavobacterium sp. UMI-01]
MKKLILSLAIVSALFTSCTSDDNGNNTTPVVGEITGTITANKVYPKGTYTLKGIVKVASGVTVTFDAGSTITCDKATGDNAFVVLNGGKAIMNGSASEPIVFTEKSGVPGSWGGIIIYGDAPIKGAGGLTTLLSEDGNSLNYGGTNTAHNGGTLKYVRVEYAGSKLGDGNKENNAFTFYSCGTGTTLDHLVAYKGADDGFEFFGGTVSMTNAISYGNYDDAFDWQDGWQGQLNTNWYGYQEIKGNFGMEIEASGNNNTFNPKVEGVTLKRAAGCTPEDNSAIEIDAFQFKKEGNGIFNNVIVDGYGNFTLAPTTYNGAVVKIQDATTNTNQVNGGKIKLTNVKITNTTQIVPVGATGSIVVSFPVGNFTTSSTTTGASLTAGAWATVNGSSLIK